MSAVNAWFVLLSALLGVLCTWFWLVHRHAELVPLRAAAEPVAETGWVDEDTGEIVVPVKAVTATGRYHDIASPDYWEVVGDAWFADEAGAKSAGFLRWDEAS